MPHQNDGNRVPLPDDEAPIFAGYAAHIAALDPADLTTEVAGRQADTKAAADTGNANRSRQTAVAQSIAQDEAKRRSDTPDQMSTEFRHRHETALAAILDDDAERPDPPNQGQRPVDPAQPPLSP